MLFNSMEFIFLFLPVTFAAWWMLCRVRLHELAIGALLLCSLFFYAHWNPPYILLLLGSIGANFFIQNLIATAIRRNNALDGNVSKILLAAGISLNLLLIGYFKYTNFLVSSLAVFTGASWQMRNIFLPLGISFFTFQQIACLVDTYKGKVGKIGFPRYALFVSFFPQLIAGPIVLADSILPQFDNRRTFAFSWKNLCAGVTLFSLGLFKKVILADTFSPWVAVAFDATESLTFVEAWGGALAYTMQIYFDFSGYSDMALGLGRFFGISLPVNFNSPYKATSIIEFWRRWHMTLSAFLRDYLYIPLGGNRKGSGRRYGNLFVTMLLGGLWHGAGWTFVAWGALHGAYLAVNHLWRERVRLRVPRTIGWLLTAFSVIVGWVFFRADSFTRAGDMLSGMIGMNGIVLPPNYVPAFLAPLLERIGIAVAVPSSWFFGGARQITGIFAGILITLFLPNPLEWTESSPWTKRPVLSAAYVAVLCLCAVLSLQKVTEFLYFQF